MKHLFTGLVLFSMMSACAPQSQNKNGPDGLPKVPIGPKGVVEEDPTPTPTPTPSPSASPDASATPTPTPVPTPDVSNWINQGPDEGFEGSNADKARKELKLTAGTEIIVAVIDSGVDTEHEDLQGKIWINSDEIAGNGIDDDANGYVDDVHGWNFLGTVKEGKNVSVNETTLEKTRELGRMKKLKADKEGAGGSLTAVESRYLAQLDEDVEADRQEAKQTLEKWDPIQARMAVLHGIVKDAVKVEFAKLTLQITKDLKSQDAAVIAARDELISIFEKNKFADVARLMRITEYYHGMLDHYLNEGFDPRKDIIGDDPNNLMDRNYGNPDVAGPDPSHGTHVAGIIAANRDNSIGVKGIAENVKIMAIRAVPDGDEYDKDVALSVRYAVDNGARIINMSFGKAYSPLKGDVDEAFQYAASKGVLIVHAAGNDAKDNDGRPGFPNRFIAKTGSAVAIDGWLDVGATGAFRGETLVAAFSNFGRNTVDIFAPGDRVNSTTPGNTYAVYSGTSMASPSMAGVAALVLSQKPSLTAVELRDALMENARKQSGLLVNLPGTAGDTVVKILFGALSKSEGLADAYKTLYKVLGH